MLIAGFGYYCTNDHFYTDIKSNASGNYLVTVLPYANYSETIIPPTGSGFAQTVVNNLSVTHDMLQNIILNMPCTTPPVILSGPIITSITCYSAVVEWQTDKLANGGLKYGTGDPSENTIPETGYHVLHSMTLTNLIPDTQYLVQVFASDQCSPPNGPTYSDVVSFRTKALNSQGICDDKCPVIIEGPLVSHLACIAEVVKWKTDEPTTGRVCYGQAEPLNTCKNAPNLSMYYQVELNSLQADTTYLMKVTVTDTAGCSVESPIVPFRTRDTYDSTPPVIIGEPLAIDISDTQATVIWNTDEPATSGVSCNDGTEYKVVPGDNTPLVIYHSVRIEGLKPSTRYFCTVSSKDACGNGPTLSDTEFTTPATHCTKPVIFEGPNVNGISHQSAVIRWWTDVPANTIIEYGTTANLGETASRAELVRHHNLPITGLQEDTDYFYRVISDNSCEAGQAVSDIYTFHTDLVPDTKKPVLIIEPQVIHKTDKTATIYWETDEPADTIVNYGQGSTLNQSISDGEKLNQHQMTITNLQPSTGYSQGVSSTDLSGNTASTDTPAAFTTNPAPDATPPVITEGPAVLAVANTRATVRWVTNEIADSRVNYNLQGQPLNLFAGDIAQVFEHIVVITNLQPGRTYSFKAASSDQSGNGPTSSSTLNFTTQATPDLTGPVFTAAPFASGVSKTQAVIEWNTDEPSTTQIKYGTSSDQLNYQTALPGLANAHAIILTNLNPGTTYYFRAMSMDSSGNLSESSVGQFATETPDTTPPNGTISINSGANYTNSTTVTLGLSCTDDSGCAHMQFSNDNSVWSTPEGYQNSKMWTLSSGDGIKTVYVKFQDGAGIWSIAFSDSITLQTVPPVTTASPAGGTYTSAQSVTLSANKPATIYYTKDGNDPTTSSPVYSSPISITATTTLKFFAVDLAGNQESVKTKVYTIQILCSNNFDCGSGSYCKKAEGGCNSAGVCTVRPGICPTLFMPVCGCDGATYPNECVAALAGVSVAHQGECVLPSTIGYSPTSFSFTATQGGGNPPNQTLNISNTGGGTLSWSVSDNATWLSLSPTNGTDSGAVNLSINITGITAGTYNGTLTITATGATNSPVNIPVTLTVNAPPLPATLTLLVPNGGDVLPSGGTYAICWQAPSAVVKFDLKYSTNNGTSWNLIKTVTGLNCTNWEGIPVVTENKKQCRVKVIGYDSANVKVGEDISDKPFTIEVLRVTSPNGGETLKSGSTWTIKWVTNKTIRPVAKTVLKYTTDGITWNPIKTLSGNPGTYNWTVPNAIKGKVKVILKDASGVNIGNDVSDKFFTIRP